MIRLIASALFLSAASCALALTPEGKPLAVLIAGMPSHEPGSHEHNAGVKLFATALAQGAPQLQVRVHLNEDWPSMQELDQADTILLYCDAGGEVLTKGDRLQQLGTQMSRGAGFMVLHYGLALQEMAPQALEWLGGFKQPNGSVNPTWEGHYKSFPDHPTARGVKPFSTQDEWYFHMRFTEAAGVTPVLTDHPPLASLESACCGFESNPDVVADLRAGKAQATAWAFERPNGGRAFGFSGGHFHSNWGNDDQRKLLLNAILWTAKVDVPKNGVESHLSAAQLKANLDIKKDDD